MSVIEELKSLGANVDEGLDRVMGDEDLYGMMLGMFLDSIRENSITLDDFAQPDLEGLIKRVHTLKGVTGNLALTPLFEGYTQSLGLLRAGDPAGARTVYETLLPAQEAVLECIRRYQGA